MSFTPNTDRGRYPGTAQPYVIPTPPSSAPSVSGPPSYSSEEVLERVIPIVGRRTAHRLPVDRRRELNHVTTRVHRTPPPTYSESELNRGDAHCDITSEFSLPVLWSTRPCVATCPACNTHGVTSVRLEACRNTHLAALALCLCGCWPCCLVPYVTDACKAARHHCRRCHYLLAVHDPWTNRW